MSTKIRCAIYTRKSSEDGLEQEFNSLHAQREACAAYVASQKAEGWVLLPEPYDDGGISGATMERPALQRLLADLDEGRVDQIVVYKIDRLSRSLSDFARIVDRLDAAGASFVSITQSFNTATSMGRLTLNMLLSFAQFEREVTAERIRDKIAASKKKGLWMGGCVPLGYEADKRTLLINETEAETIRTIYDLYLEHHSIRTVKTRADRLGLRSKHRPGLTGKRAGGTPLDRGHIHQILTNPIYAGRIRHYKNVYDGQHPAIIDPEVWERVQNALSQNSGRNRGQKNAAHPSPLAGRLFDETGDRLSPSHSRKNGRRLRYYISHRLMQSSRGEHPEAWRLPAPQLEAAIANALRTHLETPAFLPSLVPDLAAAEAGPLRDRVGTLASKVTDDGSLPNWIDLIEKATVSPGNLCIRLDAACMADYLGLSVDRLAPGMLSIASPFQLRRKGVETRIVLGGETAEIDHTLIRNIVKAIGWFEAVKLGQTFTEIAAKEKTSARRVQDLIGLAFLAPDIIGQVLNGTLPLHVTTNYLIRNGVPADWSEQRAMLAESAQSLAAA